MSLLFPRDLEEACEMLAASGGEAVPLAGGTDLLVHWPQRFEDHRRTYVDISQLEELRQIRWTGDELILGGGVTYWQTLEDREICDAFPLLAEAARQVGAVQIQARGTWAGNIVNASPAADGVPVLMAYDAAVELVSAHGTEELPLADFYLGYKRMRRRPVQLIRALRLPRRRYDVEVFEKIGPRRAQAITKVGFAAAHSSAGWRLVANSLAPSVRRCPALEKLLEEGADVARPEDLLAAIDQDVSPIDDIRSTAEYRRLVFARTLFHALFGGAALQ
ncbi:MAG: FAD binding domain-containing protein [Acidobacteria bacterium]|nr:FAD binding domain-containing protein [Acidobacteriota bacterium]